LRTSFAVVAPESFGADEWPGGRRLQRRGWAASDVAIDVSGGQPDGDGDGDQDAAARREAARESLRPFTPDQSPLLRARIIPSHARRQLLLIVANHLIVDRRSLEILREELAARYRRLRGDGAIASESSPAQHTDFVNRQRARADGGAWRASLTHW